VVAIVARLGLGFPDLYVRRGYDIIGGRQDHSYFWIVFLPLGCGCHHRRGCTPWIQGSSIKVRDILEPTWKLPDVCELISLTHRNFIFHT
jgi:hypothetical protein